MMKYVAIAIPDPSVGQDYSKEKDIVVPNQSMSLKEILDRFTREQSLPVGMDVQDGDPDLDNPLNVDLEKMAVADLVDKEEYKNSLKEINRKWDFQQKVKFRKEKEIKEAADRAAENERIEKEVQKRVSKGNSEKSA